MSRSVSVDRLTRRPVGVFAAAALVSAALLVAPALAGPALSGSGASAMAVSGVAAAAGQGRDAVSADSGIQAAPKALTLGMTYVVPPHVAGSKVRTPEGLAPLLAERLPVKALQAVPAPQASRKKGVSSTLGPGLSDVDALLLPLAPDEAAAQDGVVIPTGYRAGIMAIMRTDTDIHRWEDLRGRTVCLAEGSGLTGQLQARYGAIEKVYRAPADALLDLRIGGCDATVHDSTLLEALLAFPEWKKFSARLPVREERDLAFVVDRSDTALAQVLQSQVSEWQQSDLLARLTRQSARDIAFEVYMDQEVPDCH